MNDRPCAKRARCQGLRVQPRRKHRPHGFHTFAGDAVQRGQLEHGAVKPRDGADLGIAEVRSRAGQ